MNDTEAVIFLVIVFAGAYTFGAYVLYRVGLKFGVGSFGVYCVPVYNLVLICRCARIHDGVAVGASVWLLGLVIPAPGLVLLLQGVSAGCGVYLWGSVARRMGQPFWPWGLGCALLGIPVLVLAFGAFKPLDAGGVPSEDITYEPILDDNVPQPIGGAATLVCETGEYAGAVIDLTHEGLVIGRDPRRANLVLSSDEVSAGHCRFMPDPNDAEYVVLTDLDSTNGTYRLVVGAGVAPRWERVQGSVRLARRTQPRLRIGQGVATFQVR